MYIYIANKRKKEKKYTIQFNSHIAHTTMKNLPKAIAERKTHESTVYLCDGTCMFISHWFFVIVHGGLKNRTL